MKTIESKREATTERAAAAHPSWLNLVLNEAQKIHFGVVQVVIHESRVVRIETTRKHKVDEDGE